MRPGDRLRGHGSGAGGRGERPEGEHRAGLPSLRTDGRGNGNGRGPGGDADPGPVAELARLADTYGLRVVGRLTQARSRPDRATYRGSGKVDELSRLVEEEDADVVVEQSPAQVRDLADRTASAWWTAPR